MYYFFWAEVSEFGGSSMQFVNDAFGTTRPTECPEGEMGELLSVDFEYQQTRVFQFGTAGVKKVQCCRHPWMQVEYTVVEDEDEPGLQNGFWLGGFC